MPGAGKTYRRDGEETQLLMSPPEGKVPAIITLGCALLLMALLVFFNIISDAFNPVIMLAVLIPPALTVPGLIRGASRSYQWLCFVALFYMTHGILLAFTPSRRVPGLVETAVCLTMFFSAIIFIRARRRID